MEFELSQLRRPIASEPSNSACGDNVLVLETEESIFLALFDGAGHGLAAASIADYVVTLLENQSPHLSLIERIEALHKALRGTRGGVISVCQIVKITNKAVCSGIGNVNLRLFSDKPTRFLVRGGILGYEITKPLVHEFSLKANDFLILHSDGIRERFELTDIPDYLDRTSDEIAEIMIEHYAKDMDDASVIVLKVKND